MDSLRKVLNGQEDEEASLFGNNVSAEIELQYSHHLIV